MIQMRTILLPALFSLFLVCCQEVSPGADRSADIVIYGGTSGAITAAIQAKRLGHSVMIVCPDRHLGGLTSGGLGWTDTGNKAVIGGLSREFYHRVWKFYDRPEAWRFQSREAYGNKGQGNPAIDGQQRTMWIFEPHVAEKVFEDWIREAGIEVIRETFLDRGPNGVVKEGKQVRAIRSLQGDTYRARIFIDATYEGDLMASAGISFRVGRESNDQYDEQWNGNQVGILHHRHHFGVLKQGISPYKVPGDPKSGLLPHVDASPPGVRGEGDHRVQAYCFRMCLTDHAENRVPFTRPEGYSADEYELLRRILNAGWREGFQKFDPIPNRKTDTNNHGPFSTDYIGQNYDYPNASYERRREILERHRRYQQGLMYFLANDSGIPAEVRDAFSRWGLASDEFVDNGHWPHQLYVREARRMIGSFVMTEHEILKNRPVVGSIGMGSYTIDSHNVRRYVTQDGFVQNEGDIGVSTRGPYSISMRSILPKDSEVTNVIVPICLSCTHIAFGSIRMEPVFMILGESASSIASLAIRNSSPVQSVSYADVRKILEANGQVLQLESSPDQVSSDSIRGIIVDNEIATLRGKWTESTATKPYWGSNYLHDNNDKSSKSEAVFETQQPLQGRYRVWMSYCPASNRTRSLNVTIHHQNGSSVLSVDQTQAPSHKPWKELGTFRWDGTAGRVVITNAQTEGHVVVDAFRWEKMDP